MTTWVRIFVSIYDTDGNEQKVFAETPIWIAPLGEANFRVDLPEHEHEQLENIEFCKHDDLVPKSCVTWGVIDVMGLTI